MTYNFFLSRHIQTAWYVTLFVFFGLFFITQSAFAATATVSVSPSSIDLGQSVTVTWSSTGASSCVGTGFNTGSATSGSTTVTPSSGGTKTYSIVCYDPSPTCSLQQTSSYTDDAPGINNCSSNITYIGGSCFLNGGTCRSSQSQGGGQWLIKQFQCQGGCSSPSASDTVTVNTPPPPSDPTVTLSASPSSVVPGESTLLSWSSTEAVSCDGTNFSTNGDTSGSITLTPSENTTYSVTCTGQTYSSNPGTYSYSSSDTSDIYCAAGNPNPNNVYSAIPDCPANPEGAACVGSGQCKVNTVNGCFVETDLYQCDGGTSPTLVSDDQLVKVNTPPEPITIAGPTFGIVDTDYTFDFSSTDADDDPLRYGVDWNLDLSYELLFLLVPSGEIRNGTYSWSTPGEYSFRAFVNDNNGAYSSPLFTYHTITISETAPECSDGIDNDGDGDIDLADPGCFGGGGGGNESPNPECSDGVDNDGDGNTDYPADLSCNALTGDDESAVTECSDGIDNDGDGDIDYPADGGCDDANDDSEASAPPALSFDVTPGLVRSGDSVSITWSATDVQSCTVTGTNGDSWSGASGSQVSSALTSETTFTLSCLDLEDETTSASETVKIAPSFEEI